MEGGRKVSKHPVHVLTVWRVWPLTVIVLGFLDLVSVLRLLVFLMLIVSPNASQTAKSLSMFLCMTSLESAFSVQSLANRKSLTKS